MRAHDGRVEHLHQVGAPAQPCQSVEEGFEYPRSAQAPEALPDAVPVPELGGQRPPSDVVMGKIMQRLQELSIIPALVATTRARGFKHLQRHVPIRFGHTRQQCRLPYRPTPYESRLTRFVNRENDFSFKNPSTRPRTSPWGRRRKKAPPVAAGLRLAVMGGEEPAREGGNDEKITAGRRRDLLAVRKDRLPSGK